MILALDISTSCTGYCIFDEDGFNEIGFIDMGKYIGLFNKAAKTKSVLLEIKARHDITFIAVEENLQKFRSGFSSASVISTLAAFNGITRYICYDMFGIEPESIGVIKARKSVGLKLNRKSVVSTKDQVLDWVKRDIPSIKWESRVVTRGKKKGQTVPLKENYDMADAYVIARAAIIICNP